VRSTPDRVLAAPERLREAMRGVRGLLLDLDGVIVVAGRPVPGAVDAIAALEARRLPYRIVTNTSLVSRAGLARLAEQMGMSTPADRFESALSVSAAYTARHFADRPLYVLASDDARTEFAGQHLLTHEEAARAGARAAAVVIGDSPEELSYQNLNRAFRLIRNGAELIGMHRNPWWLTPDGPTLDAGALVTGLEWAAAVRARILGKPSRAFFVQAARDLGREVAGLGNGGGRVRRAELAMIGDDVWTDVLAARRQGLRGILVLSGKHGLADIEKAAAQRRGGGSPDAVAPSLAEVVAALD
jgi:HAD superfamily hydrolase (TIGR01458 family)